MIKFDIKIKLNQIIGMKLKKRINQRKIKQIKQIAIKK